MYAIGERKDIYRVFVGNSKGKRTLCRSRLLRENNIILIVLQIMERGTWIGLWWFWIESGCGKF
jgi:hypothetical protein